MANKAPVVLIIFNRPELLKKTFEKVRQYQPKELFETGIAKTVAWYLNNEQWWQSVMDGSYQNWIAAQYK